ncbi:phospholipid carrier-dependent glycosyltransferase [Plectonema cf. radiosum LEGE 06105]|uniref:Polyprenol-phosphate-mannose--protein mannosyltransferase n=1 Tax=Plectonema cf. radiosum LEGE 06105 TaxID=945769 RepID=A0A8J7F7M3_9CYAN|nr:phospholipid carrier-dependent glycosyltransferase [Plectonema radiosum]MBE9216990.1 phospholipid carrier-dependent glycosyltransferase [Plectonema cf. radiosum LEGE 06105]
MTKKQSSSWFKIAIFLVFLLSMALRFWGLGRFNTLVFDEVYYAKFAQNYLTQTPFFDGHPPLGKYIIAIGMWLSSYFPFGQDTVNILTGVARTPWSYRWINALFGAFIPLIIAGIAYQLSYRRSFAFLAALFAACDGIFLVESRYALINQYIVIFGLLAQWLLLLALGNTKKRHKFYLILSGVSFGAAIATKWNGLFFLIGVYLNWIFAWVKQHFAAKDIAIGQRKNLEIGSDYSITYSTTELIKSTSTLTVPQEIREKPLLLPLQKIGQLKIFTVGFYLGIIPLITYGLIWIPHLLQNPKYGLISVHQQILSFHNRLGGNSSSVHPYCAAWYKWPLLTRPIAYFYQRALNVNEPVPNIGPPLPANTGKVIYDVHAMGNPFLWWFSFAAIVLLIFALFIRQIVIPSIEQKRLSFNSSFSIDTGIALYLVLNYAANLLPWVKVNRCVFIYHYMTAVVFAFMALAWLIDKCLRSYHVELCAFGVAVTFLIIIAFIFWMPIYLGLPLSADAYKLRMWFGSWI